MIQVKDQGVGFDIAIVTARAYQVGHVGLFSVNERLTLFGGQLETESSPGQGTQITIRVPVT